MEIHGCFPFGKWCFLSWWVFHIKLSAFTRHGETSSDLDRFGAETMAHCSWWQDTQRWVVKHQIARFQVLKLFSSTTESQIPGPASVASQPIFLSWWICSTIWWNRSKAVFFPKYGDASCANLRRTNSNKSNAVLEEAGKASSRHSWFKCPQARQQRVSSQFYHFFGLEHPDQRPSKDTTATKLYHEMASCAQKMDGSRDGSMVLIPASWDQTPTRRFCFSAGFLYFVHFLVSYFPTPNSNKLSETCLPGQNLNLSSFCGWCQPARSQHSSKSDEFWVKS